MIDSPCHECKERHEYCHEHCQKYTDWKREIDKANAIRKAKRREFTHSFYKKRRSVDHWHRKGKANGA